MNDEFAVARQITTGHSDLADLTPEEVTAAIDKIDELLPVKILLENVAALKNAL